MLIQKHKIRELFTFNDTFCCLFQMYSVARFLQYGLYHWLIYLQRMLSKMNINTTKTFLSMDSSVISQ